MHTHKQNIIQSTWKEANSVEYIIQQKNLRANKDQTFKILSIKVVLLLTRMNSDSFTKSDTEL